MTERQYKVKVHQSTQNKKIYISVGANVGFAIRDFVYGKEVYAFKPGALLFLAKYKEGYVKEHYNKKINISVYASQTIFSFISSSQKLRADLDIFGKATLAFPSQEEFPELFKQFTIEYRNQFSDERKEELLYSEFLHYHKRFSMDSFHQSIESLTFEDVKKVQEYIFQKIRYKLYIHGDVKENAEAIEYLRTKSSPEFMKPIIIPRTEEEVIWKHIHFQGVSETQSYLVHTNIFQVPVEDVYLTYQFLNQWYNDKKMHITIDSIEMGAILPDIKDIEDFQVDRDLIQQYRDNILRQYEYLSSRKQLFYSIYFMKLWLAGLDYLDYYLYLQKLSPEEIETKLSLTLRASQFCTVESSHKKMEVTDE